jgi:hypothetical protein
MIKAPFVGMLAFALLAGCQTREMTCVDGQYYSNDYPTVFFKKFDKDTNIELNCNENYEKVK